LRKLLLGFLLIFTVGCIQKPTVPSFPPVTHQHPNYKPNTKDSLVLNLFVLDVPLYKTYVGIIVSNNIPEVVKFTKEYLQDSTISELDFMDAGLTLTREGYAPIIWIPSFEWSVQDIGVVDHELLHATFYILNYVGIHHGEDSEEAFTYLFENLSNQSLTLLQNFVKGKNKFGNGL
jgi:hypothetical protein